MGKIITFIIAAALSAPANAAWLWPLLNAKCGCTMGTPGKTQARPR